MKDNYTLLGLNRKEYVIMELKENKGIIEVELGSKKKKVRCPICSEFTSSIHYKVKPIRSKYIDSCGQEYYNN